MAPTVSTIAGSWAKMWTRFEAVFRGTVSSAANAARRSSHPPKRSATANWYAGRSRGLRTRSA
jgi:hypothetical protein